MEVDLAFDMARAVGSAGKSIMGNQAPSRTRSGVRSCVMAIRYAVAVSGWTGNSFNDVIRSTGNSCDAVIRWSWQNALLDFKTPPSSTKM